MLRVGRSRLTGGRLHWPWVASRDRALHFAVFSAGELLGVELLDHVVVGGPGRWVSLARRGLL